MRLEVDRIACEGIWVGSERGILTFASTPIGSVVPQMS